MNDKPNYRVQAGSDRLPTQDGLQNVVANLNTNHDKRSANRFNYTTNNWDLHQLEAAYQSNWIARQIVNVPVDDAVREWRSWQSESAQEIEQEEKRLRIPYYYKLARYWARLYGGAIILMMTDQPLNQPLDVDRIGPGSLKRLVVMDRWEIQPQAMNYTNPIAEDYLMPEWYSVRGGHTEWIHSSHIIRVDGEELPRRFREWNEGWGDSKLRLVLEDLQDITATKGGISSMVLEANVDIIQRDGLSNELASGQESAIMQRYALAGQMKSLVNQLLLDGSETYERKELSFSGLAEILDKLMVWVSGASDIPMTRLFGQSAAGMNATGEGDLNNYYDSVRSMQESVFRPDLEKLDQVLVKSALGDFPDDVDWEWNPLYQESGTELAQQELAWAQAESARLDQGVLQQSHIAERLRQTGYYSITDDEIEAMRADEQAERNGDFEPDMGNDPSAEQNSE